MENNVTVNSAIRSKGKLSYNSIPSRGILHVDHSLPNDHKEVLMLTIIFSEINTF